MMQMIHTTVHGETIEALEGILSDLRKEPSGSRAKSLAMTYIENALFRLKEHDGWTTVPPPPPPADLAVQDDIKTA